MDKKTFPASTGSLHDASAFIEAALEGVGCGMKTAIQISVAFEEIFVNIAHYAYPDAPGTVDICIEAAPDSISVQFIDSGIPFNPLLRPDPDITLSADERKIGGLGIFMVKKSMDSVAYEYKDGCNIFTMVKNI